MRFLVTAIIVLVFTGGLSNGSSLHSQTYSQKTRLRTIEKIIADGIRRKRMPGCVVVIGSRDQILYRRAFGRRQIVPTAQAMTIDTVFDLASLTKPIATATSVMKLAADGKIKISDSAAKYWPEFAANGKRNVTVEQLLLHTSGLIADNSLNDYRNGMREAMKKVANQKLVAKPGERFIYSDVGYIALAEIVRRISGKTLEKFTQENIFKPLQMNDTMFTPREVLVKRAAPADRRDGKWIKGVVHDPRAFHMNGVAGHAGLFSTADDLAKYCRAMLSMTSTSESGQSSILPRRQIREMIRPRKIPTGSRTWGWDHQTGYSTNRGDLFSKSAFGHGGFTGTAVWIDPDQDLFVIFLSNRLHPDGRGSVNRLIGRICSIASATFAKTKSDYRVLNGIDVLKADNFRILRGKRVGLITNQTGIDAAGRSTIEILHQSKQVNLVALFSPEHGILGKQDQHVNDAIDKKTGLKIHSLYGKSKKPDKASLQKIDVLVFDIQDIGTRFYTYMSTMCLAMRAASEMDIDFVVLDRPNPVNGVDVSGPVLDAGAESFVGIQRVSIRHGMTAGELALMYATEQKLRRKPTIVKMKGWKRTAWLDQINSRWVNPSPNIRNLNQATIYPGLGMLETTNISVGRGTDSPFEIFGAPWINGSDLAKRLRRHGRGVSFVPTTFTPQSSKFAGQMCFGVQIIITNRDQFDPVETGIQMALALKQLYPRQWQTQSLNRLIGNREMVRLIRQQRPSHEIQKAYQAELEKFKKRREKFLLYNQ